MDTANVNIYAAEDDCCGPRWEKASLAGKLDNVTEWPCPKCGTVWLEQDAGPFRSWTPQEWVDVFHSAKP